MADALIFTRDFVEASVYLDKAISGFVECGRKDWEMVERYRKAELAGGIAGHVMDEELFRVGGVDLAAEIDLCVVVELHLLVVLRRREGAV